MSTTASSVKLEDVSRTAVNDTDAEAAAPADAAASASADQPAAATKPAAPNPIPPNPVTPSPVVPPYATYSQRTPDPQPTKDRYTRGIVVGILFSCFVAAIPISIGLSMGAKQQETLTFTRGQVLDLRTNLALNELNELQARMKSITEAEQQLVALLQDKSRVSAQITAKQTEVRTLQQQAAQLAGQRDSLLEQAKSELGTTVSDSLSKLAE